MKKKGLWIGLGVVLVSVIVAAGVMKNARGNVQAVQMARVRIEDVTSRVRAPGKIEPKTQVKVSADIPGKIVHLAVKEGDRVQKGQLLLQLDDTQYRANFNQSRAAFASAQARVREAESAFKVSDSNYSRQRALFEKNLLSQAEWDQASTNHDAARVTLQTAQEEVARSTAAMQGAEDNLSKCRFAAPFEGVVSALNVEQGEIVITGTMNNAGTQILDMKVGQQAKITVDAVPDTSFAGTVIEIGNTAKRSITSAVEGQTNFEVKVVFDKNVPQVRPGMTADVEIETATHAKAQAVPIQAVVIRTQRELDRAAHGGKKDRPKRAVAFADEDTAGRKDPELTGVFVVRNGVAQFAKVRTGIASESMIEVFGELNDKDHVVSGPSKALRELKPGTKVKQETPGGRGKKS